MRYRTFYLIATALAVVVLAAAVYVIAKPRTQESSVTLVFPREPADQLLWPNNASWVWSIKGLDLGTKGRTLSLVVRVVRERQEKGTSPVIEPRVISKAKCEAEISGGGKFAGLRLMDSALVSVQLLNLAAVGVPTEGKKRPLRLLLGFHTRSGTIHWDGEKSVIDGERLVGNAPHLNPKWRDGELHLQTLFVKTGDRLAIYDVVVLQTD